MLTSVSFSDRDWLHPALPTTERKSKRKRDREKEREKEKRERESEARTLCHYYPIISCVTVTVNEVSYYAAYRGGG